MGQKAVPPSEAVFPRKQKVPAASPISIHFTLPSYFHLLGSLLFKVKDRFFVKLRVELQTACSSFQGNAVIIGVNFIREVQYSICAVSSK